MFLEASAPSASKAVCMAREALTSRAHLLQDL